MSKTYFDNEPDNFVKKIREVIKFHQMYGKKVNDDYVCITCGAEIEHNYGTDEYPQCIICGNEPAQSN
jgi:DNA-directed RNA polymerase subunit RPC12/RpoP